MFIGKMVSARGTTGPDLVISRFTEMEPIIPANIESPNGRTCPSIRALARKVRYALRSRRPSRLAEGDAWTAHERASSEPMSGRA
jgi:hypothetical protein